MTERAWRTLTASVAAVLLTVLASGCGSDDGAAKPAATGLLTASDLPFEPTSDGDISRPPILTQLSTSCTGIEQGVLYEAGWKVRAREFYDSADWSVISALLTPPGKGGASGLQQVSDRLDECAAKDKGTVKVTPLDLGEKTFAYEIDDSAGTFDSARGYRQLSGGRLVQVSLLELPKGQDASSVLEDLLGKASS